MGRRVNNGIGGALLSCLFIATSLFSSAVYAQVTINGKVYKGSKVTVIDGQVTVDGKVVEESKEGPVIITVNGTLEQLTTDRSVEVEGDISGPVTASGRVKAKTINGNVKATGSVRAEQINGNIDAVGRVSCK